MASPFGQVEGTSPVKKFFARALAFYNPCFQVAGPRWDREAIFEGTEGIGDALKKACGTKFDHEDNVSCDVFRKRLDVFIEQCREQRPRVVYLYICTHGVKDPHTGRLHLMMNDSPDPNLDLDGFIRSSISGEELARCIEKLRQANATGKVIVLLDCCRAGALSREFGPPTTLGSNITDVRKNDDVRCLVQDGSGTLFFMSCGEDERSEICANHSGPLFTKAVATTLVEPPRQGIGVETLIAKVQEKVQGWSAGRQNPTYYCPDPGNLGYFGISSTESPRDMPMDLDPTGESLGQQSPNPARKHVLFVARRWGWCEEDTVCSIIKEMAIQLAQNQNTPGNNGQAVRVSYLVPQEVTEQQEKEADENRVALLGIKLGPGKELSDCFDERVDHVDTVVGYGIEFGTQARRIQKIQKSKRIHIVSVSHEDFGMCHYVEEPVSETEDRQEKEEELCQESDLAITIGTHLKDQYQFHPEGRNVSIVEYTPSIFEFPSGSGLEKTGDSFRILVFYPSSSKVKAKNFTDKIAELFPGDKFHLTVAGIPKQSREELKSVFHRYENIRDKLTLRGPCKTLKGLHQWFCQADVLLLLFGSSNAEDFGIYALQAISAALPVLVSDRLRIAYALKGLEYGSSTVVSPDKPKMWQQQIKQLAYKDPALRSSERRSLREYYQKAYPWNQQIQQVTQNI